MAMRNWNLCAKNGVLTIQLSTMDKNALFPFVRVAPLPRKTFSMGEVTDKRYYLETHRIR